VNVIFLLKSKPRFRYFPGVRRARSRTFVIRTKSQTVTGVWTVKDT